MEWNWFGSFPIFASYAGKGFLMLLYAAAVVYLFRTEKVRRNRVLLLYLPSVILVAFFLTPVRALYTLLLGEADTYYRMLWLVPFGITVCYAFVKVCGKYVWTGFVVCAALIVLCGHFVYRESIISRAQNKYHLPGAVIRTCDLILSDMPKDADFVICCFPEEMVQQVRQYTTKLWLVYGRDVVHWDYLHHEALTALRKDVVDAEMLDAAIREDFGVYLVLHTSRQTSTPLETLGWNVIASTDGYDIYRRTDYYSGQ